MPGKMGNLGTWFLGNFDFLEGIFASKTEEYIKKYRETKLAILEGNFDWIPWKKRIFPSCASLVTDLSKIAILLDCWDI